MGTTRILTVMHASFNFGLGKHAFPQHGLNTASTRPLHTAHPKKYEIEDCKYLKSLETDGDGSLERTP
ncbi:MAG: hypothetical protein AAF720_04055 [Pseudomonadota bacterium]